MSPIIKFKDINKSYGSTVILDNFNLEIEKGEFITMIGSSGSGKTTILKMINGLIVPTKGTIYVEDKDGFNGRKGYGPGNPPHSS